MSRPKLFPMLSLPEIRNVYIPSLNVEIFLVVLLSFGFNKNDMLILPKPQIVNEIIMCNLLILNKSFDNFLFVCKNFQKINTC